MDWILISTVRRLKLMRVQRELRRAQWRARLQLDGLERRLPKVARIRRSRRLNTEH
ncbi:hypothetical protein HY229_05275 [Candidatus Acetothermia bacterium]|nr:hypothetical protein [Candidatus Acetothermia bacterium]MBI3643495.1 hypothetical protein [Candidatus Acetothermia bacterium]